MTAESVLLVSNSEPEVTSNVGAKENGTIFDDVDDEDESWSGSKGNKGLWADEDEED